MGKLETARVFFISISNSEGDKNSADYETQLYF
jgi:hypothetical protein